MLQLNLRKMFESHASNRQKYRKLQSKFFLHAVCEITTVGRPDQYHHATLSMQYSREVEERWQL